LIITLRWKKSVWCADRQKKKFCDQLLAGSAAGLAGGEIRDMAFVVLVGGSSLDFEIPQMITDALSHYGVVAGQGNIRGTEGPRNAVATGLVYRCDTDNDRVCDDR
jgi:diol dehydratase reactivase alpha subunit